VRDVVAIRTRPGLFRRPSTWIAMIAAALVVGVGVGVALGWRAALSRTLMSARCRPIPAADMTVDEIVDLKLRWKAYRRDPSADARFELSPREAAFLISGEGAASVHLESVGDRLTASLAIPVDGGGCYNVDFVGQVQVDRGVALVDPDRLVVGGTDLAELNALGGALGGTRKVIHPSDITDPELRAGFANVDKLTIEGGRVFLRFIDPDQVWR
jgi:hypothetical protein